MLLLYLCLVLFAYMTLQPNVDAANSYPADVIEDGSLNTEQLIRKYNYPVETHFVTTRDGYILQLHRIRKDGGEPILLQHGLLDSSGTYVLMGPSSSLGYYLYDHGKDVWLGNARGNRYSRNHTSLDPDKDESFWNFSWHEIAINDIPTMIDYILQTTNSDKLYYVGHSQGTTVLFVMCSMRPEYNDKIILAHALAPVAFMRHMPSALLVHWKTILRVRNILDQGETLPRSNQYGKLCLSSKRMEDICLNLFFIIVGRDVEQLNRTKLPTILGHIPAGAASKQVKHYNQLIESAKFCQFDYEEHNQEVYGQNEPPDYDLTKVTVPVVLYYGLNDPLSAVANVMRLIKQLPNVVEAREIELPLWNHIDFLYGKDARKLINDPIEVLNNKSHEK